MTQCCKVAGGFEFDLLLDADRFHGIGEVRAGETPLRSDRAPWTLQTAADHGWQFVQWRLRDIRQVAGGFDLTLTSRAEWDPVTQVVDALGERRIHAPRLDAPEAELTWAFRPWQEMIGDETFAGFTHQIHLATPNAPVHWLLERATWELGGSAADCTLIQQDLSLNGMEQPVQISSAFTTAEGFVGGEWAGSYPMDMLPRGGGSCICDFQSKAGTTICIFTERPGLTRSRIDKHAGEDVVHYLEHTFFERGEQRTLPLRTFAIYQQHATLARHERRNLWLDCFSHVRQRMHEAYGFQLERPQPSVHAHLWDRELQALGKEWHRPLCEALPALAAHGFKALFTFIPYMSPADDEASRSGNICCPYDITLSERFGGATTARELTAAAAAAGMDVFQWIGFHLSAKSEIWRQHPDWVLRQASGRPWDGGYGSLWAGDLGAGFAEHLTERIKQLQDQTGLAGLFWDSYQNLGLTGVPWQTPERQPQADPIWRLQTAMQQRGLRQRIECLGIFGVSQISLFGFDDSTTRRRLWQDVVDNDWAFAFMDTSPGFFTEGTCFSPQRVTPEHYFWLAAHRCLPIVSANPWGESSPHGLLMSGDEAAYARTNHLYATCETTMSRLRLLPDGAAVLWLDATGRPACVWAFAETQLDIPAQGRCVESGDVVGGSAGMKVKAGRVYMLQDATQAEQQNASKLDRPRAATSR
ncbi:MAG: hypothetical protein WD534_06255 [Phycisphaeraceae bacterium]